MSCGSLVATHDGTYTATITSSTVAGSPTMTATDSSVAPAASGQATLRQTPGPAASVAVRFTSPLIVASGTSQSTAITTVIDAHGNPISGDRVGFSSSDIGEQIGTVTDNHDGTCTATDSSVDPAVSGQATLAQVVPRPAATVQPAFSQALPGRRLGRKCVAQRNANRNHAACTRSVFRGSLRLSARAGVDRVSFAGRVSRTRKLAPGTYTMTLTASNGTGRSAPARISFTAAR